MATGYRYVGSREIREEFTESGERADREVAPRHLMDNDSSTERVDNCL